MGCGASTLRDPKTTPVQPEPQGPHSSATQQTSLPILKKAVTPQNSLPSLTVDRPKSGGKLQVFETRPALPPIASSGRIEKEKTSLSSITPLVLSEIDQEDQGNPKPTIPHTPIVIIGQSQLPAAGLINVMVESCPDRVVLSPVSAPPIRKKKDLLLLTRKGAFSALPSISGGHDGSIAIELEENYGPEEEELLDEDTGGQENPTISADTCCSDDEFRNILCEDTVTPEQLEKLESEIPQDESLDLFVRGRRIKPSPARRAEGSLAFTVELDSNEEAQTLRPRQPMPPLERLSSNSNVSTKQPFSPDILTAKLEAAKLRREKMIAERAAAAAAEAVVKKSTIPSAKEMRAEETAKTLKEKEHRRQKREVEKQLALKERNEQREERRKKALMTKILTIRNV